MADYIEICNLKVTQIYMSDPAACEYIIVLTKDRIYLYNFPILIEISAIMRMQNSPCVGDGCLMIENISGKTLEYLYHNQ